MLRFPAEAKRDPVQKMKALIWHGNKDVRCEEVPKVMLTEPRDGT
jgi:hypothetical protein